MEAASVPAEGGAPGEGAEQQQQGSNFDLSPVMDRVGEIGQSVGQVVERLNALDSRIPAQEPQGEPEYDLMDPAGMDLEDPAQAQQYLEQLVDKRAGSLADERVRAATEPLLERLDDISTREEVGTFLSEFPQYADPERGEAFINTARDLAAQMGVPEEMQGRMIGNAGFLRMAAVYSQQAEAARTERPAEDARELPLEPAGGGSAIGGGEPNLAQRIVGARGGNSLWGT